MTAQNKQLTKDVATEIERRRRRRKLIVWSVIIAIIVAAILYLGFGRGWGLGTGTGTGSGSGSRVRPAVAIPSDAGPARCTVRITAEGITVDGDKLSRDDAVARCKATEGAMVTVTGDARQGDWDELRAALQAVGVKIYIRGQLWDGSAAPQQNP